MRARVWFFALAVVFTAYGASGAQNQIQRYGKACEAYNRGAYHTAFRELLPFAVRGDAQAQFAIGEMLRTGMGTRRNREEALVWYRRSAEQGHAAAQCNLGTSLFNGWGAEPDPQAAIDWWLQAALNDNAHAMFNLGAVIAQGRYVIRDFARAYWWLSRASENGYVRADDVLATLHKVMTNPQVSQARKLTLDDAIEFTRRRPIPAPPKRKR